MTKTKLQEKMEKASGKNTSSKEATGKKEDQKQSQERETQLPFEAEITTYILRDLDRRSGIGGALRLVEQDIKLEMIKSWQAEILRLLDIRSAEVSEEKAG